MLHFENCHLFGRFSVWLKRKIQLESMLSSQCQVNFYFAQSHKLRLANFFTTVGSTAVPKKGWCAGGKCKALLMKLFLMKWYKNSWKKTQRNGLKYMQCSAVTVSIKCYFQPNRKTQGSNDSCSKKKKRIWGYSLPPAESKIKTLLL